MDLLVSPALIEKYINCCKKLKKTGDDKVLSMIFENSNNRFILNKKLLAFYESQFELQSSELDIFQAEFTEIINERGVSKPTVKTDLKDVLIDTQSAYLKDKSKEIYLNLSEDNADSCSSEFSAKLANIGDNKSIDYLYFKLASNNPAPVTFWYYDFASNIEIKNLFNNIFNLFRWDELDIFDAYSNVKTHSYYDSVLNKNYKFNYYTEFFPLRKRFDRININVDLRDYFKRVFIYRAVHSTYIHERRIKFSNLSVEVNNDLANVNVAEPTWKIDIYVCDKVSSEADKKKVHFARDVEFR